MHLSVGDMFVLMNFRRFVREGNEASTLEA